jgi:deoxycytidylate deaminase
MKTSPKLRRAVIQESLKSKCRFKLGAVIAKGNRILARGYNENKTHPRFGSGRFKMLHAESAAILDAVRKGVDMEGATMYVFRYNNNLAKPCECCQRMIDHYGIAKVVYSDGLNFSDFLTSKKSN